MSTSKLFELPETVQRLHEGPLAAHIDTYASRLFEQGFSSERARDRIRLIADFSRWLQRQKLEAADVTRQTVDRYLKTQKRGTYILVVVLPQHCRNS
jgi:site-specific recombinase XerD